MMWFWILIGLSHKLALGLAAGASTFAVAFYLGAFSDGVIDQSERRFMGIVYFVIRTALAIIVATQFILLSSFIPDRLSLLLNDPTFVLNWIILAVIMGNAVLMTLHKMPMWLGPALAGGSWYSLFILHNYPAQMAVPLPVLIALYLGFLLLFGVVFALLKKRFVVPPPTAASPIS